MNKTSNRLINEKSPYLLQHAYNPVDWYPWSEEAFTKAKNENKPVFLSIGYSTCHWCHVMEHESFEDNEVAALMNKNFISIKVDREERPDIDNIYMTVCQIITGSGGWPLTIFLTPDKKPFFAGTYFPRDSFYERIGMMDLLPRIRELWDTKSNDVFNSAEQITIFLNKLTIKQSSDVLDESILRGAYEQFKNYFDSENGGFGSAPKFPTPHNLMFLLRWYKKTKDKHALEMVEKTLNSMCLGGIYDQIGFGFHRYSTDSHWLLPHFEKMLYDQALLLLAYIEAYQITKNKDYEQTAKEIITYVLRDMKSPEGAFYSAEDADSEGKEGKFYLWTYEEINEILKDETSLFVKVFNIDKDGNFCEEATRKKTIENILFLKKPLSEIAKELKLNEEELKNKLVLLKQKLFSVREKRIHPHKDDKILTNWNGLMIAALSKAAQVFENVEFANAAKSAVNFIFTHMLKEEKLLHSYRKGAANICANLEDYAFLIWGLLELYEATLEVNYLRKAIELNNDLNSYFWDENNGGYYFTSSFSEKLIVRQKEIHDSATPSGNSVCMLNLLRLSRITGNKTFEDNARKLAYLFSKEIVSSPMAFSFMLMALDFYFGPTFEIVILGNFTSEDTKIMLRAARSSFLPNKVLLLKDKSEVYDVGIISEFVREYVKIDEKATAYVCKDYKCNLPTTDPKEILNI